MQVIFTQDIPLVGKKGHLKNVSAGYFRNYLFPRKLAVSATSDLIKKAGLRREQESRKLKEIIEKADEIKEQLQGAEIVIEKKATVKNKLYAAIKEQDVIAALKKAVKIELEKENIEFEKQIKEIGEHKVKIKLTDKVKVEVMVKVTKLEEK